MFKKILLPSLFSLLLVSQAWGATLDFNGSNWNNGPNWSGGVVGTIADDVSVSSNVTSNSGPLASVRTLTASSVGTTIFGINIAVSDGAIFSGAYQFGGFFQGNTYNVTLSGNATFNGGSYNRGIISGNATFNSTYYSPTAPSGGIFTINNTGNPAWGGQVNGSVFGSDAQVITSYVFTSPNGGQSRPTNDGIINGNATFNNYTTNNGTINGNAIFNGSGSNAGTVNGNADVYYPSANPIGGTVTGTVTYHDYPVDSTAPTITSVSSNKSNSTYSFGEVIDIDVTFSEAVTSTGNVTVTLETGVIDRTCTFTVTSATTGTCNYTVQAGDTSSDLTVSSISGIINDAALNALVNFTPTSNLAANKDIVIGITPRTLYFHSNASSTEWSDLTNWWDDSNFTIPANGLPISVDDIIASTSITTNISSPATINGFIMSNGLIPITLNIPLTVTQNAVFNDQSINHGVITGNVIFNNTSKNYADIIGNITFNDTSSNLGYVDSHFGSSIVFNDSSYNSEPTLQNGSYISGSVYEAIFNDGACNSGHVRRNLADPSYFVPNCPSSNTGANIIEIPKLDNIGPKIQNTQLSDTGIIVLTFQTDEPAQSEIHFSDINPFDPRFSPSYENNEYIINHSFSLEDLKTCTLYYYQITARDSYNNVSTFINSFITKGCIELTKPLQISNTINNISPTSATITFTTSRPTKYVLDYGLGDTYNLSTDDPTFETHRSLVLSSLNPCTEYSYKILVIDEEGVSLTSPPGSFTTNCPSPPVSGTVYPISKEEPAEKSLTNTPETPEPTIVSVNTPKTTSQVSQSTPVCGNSIIESGEVCDNGDKNGEEQCSWDCLLIINMPARNTPRNDQSVKGSVISQTKQIITKIVNNTTPKEVQKSLIKTAEETVVVAQYSVTGVIILLGGLFIALNIMILGPATWVSYTVEEGDTLSTIATRFNMFDAALLRKNPSLELTQLTPGMVLRVKNRPFLEKDYLDKLKDVLNVLTQKRKYVLPNNTPSVTAQNVPMQQV